jgi:glycosyltransferase involved in cell wall biosynthesis
MRIGFDLTIANVNQAGSANYAINLYSALTHLKSPVEFCTFAVHQSHDMARPRTFSSRQQTLYRDLIWTHFDLPRKVNMGHIDLLHVPSNIIPIQPPCPTVVSILDTIIMQSPQLFPLWQRLYSRYFLPLSAKNAAAIITISEHSKKDIVKRLQVAPSKVTVTYLGAAPIFSLVSDQERKRVRQNYCKNPFILTVGTLEPRKNLLRLIQSISILHNRGLKYDLIHVGSPGWMFDSIQQEVERLGLTNSVHFLGRIPVEDLAALYNSALVMVYPSLYEGFGLPLVEAMACGCPVISSNVSSIPEVVGDAGILIDPNNVNELADAMEELLVNRDLAIDLREKGLQRVKLFSWERCAMQTLELYYQVLKLSL